MVFPEQSIFQCNTSKEFTLNGSLRPETPLKSLLAETLVLGEKGNQTPVDQPQTHLIAPAVNRVSEESNRSLESNRREKDQEIRGSYVIGKDDFIWDKDLSENGQKLWRWLLSPSKIDFLEWRAGEEGWDLDTAMEEIHSHGLLEECEPGYFQIIRRRIS